MALTNIQCKNTKTQSKPYKLTDSAGLYLYIAKSGIKSWRYNYRINGKYKTYTYGLYPELSLQEARNKHRDIHKMVSEGHDPSQYKKQQVADDKKSKANTFENMTYQWLKKRKNEVQDETYKATIKRLELDVLPEIGHTPLSNITPLIILNMLKKIESRGAFELQKRARMYCSSILRYALAHGQIDRDYTLDIKDALTTVPTKHQPALAPKDLPHFLSVLDKEDIPVSAQIKLALNMLLLTFVRPIELVSAEWDEFDFINNRWVLPAQKTKMNKGHIVPLSEQVVDLLNNIKTTNIRSKYVFPSPYNNNRHIARDNLSKSIRHMGFQGQHTAHGFRSLALTTLLENLGYPFNVADLQLGHGKKNSLGATYDRANFLNQRITMMQDWADYIDTIVKNGYQLPHNPISRYTNNA